MKNNFPTKSEIFTAYNKARAAARKAGDAKRIDRLNKALGILLSSNYYTTDKAGYQSTTNSCGCNDMKYRNAACRGYSGVCKHVEAARLLLAIYTRRTEMLFILSPIECVSYA